MWCCLTWATRDERIRRGAIYESVTRTRLTRLVALTGYGQAEDKQRTRDAGFDEHLIKPVDFSLLRRALG
jgi:CheY-like chemotaxis protein